MRRSLLLAALLALGCSSDPDDIDDKRDAGDTTRDAGRAVLDSGVIRDGGTSTRDGGVATRDGGDVPRDGGPMMLAPELMPGSHVQVAEGRVTIGVDTLATVQQTLGAGTRGPMNTRSYEWTLSGGVELTVWFANSTLGDVSVIANDHVVLWAAVTGTYTGQTPDGIGIGSTRTEVEAAYGSPSNDIAIADPPGTLLAYFTTGIFVAVDPNAMTRTVTICRAYPQDPNGTIDPNGARLRFQSAGDIQGFRGLTDQGTRESTVRTRLGEPDAEGDIRISGQDLRTLSYGFLGIEVFFVDNPIVGSDRVAFVSVHTPYYGTTSSGDGIGTDRTTFEAYLTNQGYGAGRPSSTNAQLICYSHGNDEDVGVTYSTDMPPVVTSISMPLLTCP